VGLFSFSRRDSASVKLIVGLGNPGDAYAGTRHNLGFDVVDRLGETLGVKVKKAKFGARFGEAFAGQDKFILLKPWRFMNRSGQAVATAAGFYRLALSDLLVITDDMALDPGRIRLRAGGSAGGHNGLADIIAKLGGDRFARLRVGIGASNLPDSADYVLGRPSPSERALLTDAVQRAAEAALCWACDGIEAAMNRFNAGGVEGKDQDSPSV